MSYSFVVRGESKLDAAAKVDEQMDKVISAQEVHRKDCPLIGTGAGKMIALLGDDEGKDVKVEVSGWIVKEHEGVTQIQASIAVSLIGKD